MTIVPTRAAREAAAWSLEQAGFTAEAEAIKRGDRDHLRRVQSFERCRQAFLTEILDHLTTEHSGGLGSHPGARVIADALKAKFS